MSGIAVTDSRPGSELKAIGIDVEGVVVAIVVGDACPGANEDRRTLSGDGTQDHIGGTGDRQIGVGGQSRYGDSPFGDQGDGAWTRGFESILDSETSSAIDGDIAGIRHNVSVDEDRARVSSLQENIARSVGSNADGSWGTWIDDDIASNALEFDVSVVGSGGEIFESLRKIQVGGVEVDSAQRGVDLIDGDTAQVADIDRVSGRSGQD